MKSLILNSKFIILVHREGSVRRDDMLNTDSTLSTLR